MKLIHCAQLGMVFFLCSEFAMFRRQVPLLQR